MTRTDWLLLTLEAAGAKGLTPVQLQKTLFLLRSSLPLGAGFYKFQPYNYGPFSASIYRDAESLKQAGLVDIKAEGSSRIYLLTPAGSMQAKCLAVQSNVSEYVRSVVSWAQSLSFAQLVRAIYAKYPQYRENSIFNG
jgi:hypothetical protein